MCIRKSKLYTFEFTTLRRIADHANQLHPEISVLSGLLEIPQFVDEVRNEILYFALPHLFEDSNDKWLPRLWEFYATSGVFD